MQILGMRLPPSAIDLPLNITFPVYKQPCLDVVVRGRSVPVNTNSTLTVEVTNKVQNSVVVTGIYASYIYTSFPTELVFGSRTIRLLLDDLAGELKSPCVVRPGESIEWQANLRQLRERLEKRHLTLGPHSRYLDFNRMGIERWTRHGRPASMIRNAIAKMSHRRLAVVVRDDQGSLHKAKVRWMPPGGLPPELRHHALN